VSIDQTAIRGSRRSNPATYTGLLDPVRKAFAKANGVKPALFSANSEGACPTCNGCRRSCERRPLVVEAVAQRCRLPEAGVTAVGAPLWPCSSWGAL
jgi:hypothetical protein